MTRSKLACCGLGTLAISSRKRVPLIGELEVADAIGLGVGEGAFHVAE